MIIRPDRKRPIMRFFNRQNGPIWKPHKVPEHL